MRIKNNERMLALGIEPRSIPPQGSILPLKYASYEVLTPRVELGLGSYQDPVITLRLCELVCVITLDLRIIYIVNVES